MFRQNPGGKRRFHHQHPGLEVNADVAVMQGYLKDNFTRDTNWASVGGLLLRRAAQRFRKDSTEA
jgi:hypothetical protein